MKSFFENITLGLIIGFLLIVIGLPLLALLKYLGGMEFVWFALICCCIAVVSVVAALFLGAWIYKDEPAPRLDLTFGEMTKEESKAGMRFVGLSLLIAVPLIIIAAILYY